MAADGFYATHSVYTDPGVYASRLDHIPNELRAIREAARRLVFHYRADGDFSRHEIERRRIAEIDTRYADQMLARIFELADVPLSRDRQPNELQLEQLHLAARGGMGLED